MVDGATNSLTGVVASSADALEMLWWAAGIFEHQLSVRDGDGSNQGFALIAFAQASANLVGWVCKDAVSSGKDRSEAFRSIMCEIVWSHELRAIAEAARHANTTSPYWTGANLPVLRGDRFRLEELDAHEGQDSWFENLLGGLGHGSLWFENTINGTDARAVVIQHCTAWDEKLRR